MAVLLITGWHINVMGITLARAWYRSTDVQIWLIMGLTSMAWTTSVLISAFTISPGLESPPSILNAKPDRLPPPCKNGGSWECYARLGFIPWILIVVFTWWLISYGLNVKFKRIKLNACMYTVRRVSIVVVALALLVFTTTGALQRHLYALGVLNLAAGLLVWHAVKLDYFYLDVQHFSDMDDIRIPITSPRDSCIVYVLPSKGHGFEAAFSCKIKSEHKVLEDSISSLEPLGISNDWSLEGCRAAMNKVVLSRLESVNVFADAYDRSRELTHLAHWLYDEEPELAQANEDQGKEMKTDDQRKKTQTGVPGAVLAEGRYNTIDGKCLVGRDLVMAMLHWERLVFENRSLLYDNLQNRVWTLRSLKFGGSNGEGYDNSEESGNTHNLIGSHEADEKGFTGLEAAVEKLYRALDRNHVREIPFSFSRLFPENDEAPTNSILFHKCGFRNLKAYSEKLWERCWEVDPSTFGALYLWTAVWYIDVGNKYNIHIAPLQPNKSNDSGYTNYMTRWRMKWRHPWYTSVVCQLIVLLPTVLGNFLATVGAT
jgi:hypothetical protein